MSTHGLPPGWASTSLGDICIEKVEQRHPGDDALPYIDIGSIDRHRKTVGEVQQVTKADAPTRARQAVRAGDTLVSMTRPNLNAVALVPRHFEGAIASTGFDVLRPRGVMSEWIFNRVRSNDFVADMATVLQGVVYPAVRPHDVRKHQCPIPPLLEQRRIVEAIESYFTRLEDAVATLERVQRNLQRYRASVLKAAVEGRLVPTEAELARAERRDYEPASVLLERIVAERRRRWHEAGSRGKYQEPAAPDTTDLPDLPEGWCWATVGHFVYGIEAGKNFKCVETPPGRSQVGVVKVSAVTWGTFDEDESKTCPHPELVNETHLILPGDFLISRANTIELVGACVIVTAVQRRLMLSDKILRLRTVGGLDWWLLWVLRSTLGRREIESLATGNQESMRNIAQSGIRRLRVPVPPEVECRRIITEIERQMSVYEHSSSVVRYTAQRCQRLRQAILKWAFEGKLADQDPSDEPASVLLERIRTETATWEVRTTAGSLQRSQGRRGTMARTKHKK